MSKVKTEKVYFYVFYKFKEYYRLYNTDILFSSKLTEDGLKRALFDHLDAAWITGYGKVYLPTSRVSKELKGLDLIKIGVSNEEYQMLRDMQS